MPKKDPTLAKKCDFYKQQLEEMFSVAFDDESTNAWSTIEIEEYIKLLQSDFEKFEAKATQILCGDDANEAESKQAKEDFSEIRKKYTQAKVILRQKMQSMHSKQINQATSSETISSENLGATPSMTQQAVESKSSQVIFPKFKGSLSEWKQFSEEFINAMNSKVGMNAQMKFDALQASCSSEVNSMIIQSCANDYDKAWKKLNSMYGNAYRQAQFHMQKLLAIPNMQVANASTLRDTIIKLNDCATSLKHVFKFEQSDIFVVLVAAAKLDQETKRAWERHRAALAISWAATEENDSIKREPDEYLPSWQALHDFLESEIEIYAYDRSNEGAAALPISDIHAPSTSKVVAKQAAKVESNPKWSDMVQSDLHKNMAAVMPINALANEKKHFAPFLQCNLCEFVHPKHKCPVYKQMTFHDKKNHVAAKDLCIKCVRPIHPGQCEDPSCNEKCPTCFKKKNITAYHNSSLCPTKEEEKQQRNEEW